MKKFLVPAGVLCMILGSLALRPEAARADISCWSASSTLPQYSVPNLALAPLCDTSGNLKITGTITATDVLPYNGTNGQALTSSSFAGVGALDANGKFSPLQEDASQNLLAKLVSGSTTTVTQGTAANLNATVVGSGNFTVVQPTGSNLHTLLDSDATSTGNSLALQTLNAAISVAVVSKGVVAWQVVGLTGQSATLTFEESADGGTTWNAVNAATGTTDPASSTITTDGRYLVNVAGASNVRLRVSTAGNTTNATISYVASPAGTLDGLTLPLPPGSNTIGNVGLVAGSAVNQTTGTSGYSYILDSAGTNVAGVDANHNQFFTLRNGTNAQTVGSGGSADVAICGSAASSTCAANPSQPNISTANNGAIGSWGNSVVLGAINSSGQTSVLRLDYGAGGSWAASANALLVANGGAFKTILTSSSGTSCTSLEATASNSAVGRVVSLINTGAAMTVFLQLYDEGSSPTCAAADLIWGDGSAVVLGAAGTATGTAVLNIPLTAGLAYKLSGALTSNLVITRN